MFVYNVINDRTSGRFGPYATKEAAEAAIRAQCVDYIDVNLLTTDSDVLEKFREIKTKIDKEYYDFVIEVVKVLE